MGVKTYLESTIDNKMALLFMQGKFDRESLKNRYKLKKIASKHRQPKTVTRPVKEDL